MEFKHLFFAYFLGIYMYIALRYGLPVYSLDNDFVILIGGLFIVLSMVCFTDTQCNMFPLIFYGFMMIIFVNKFYVRKVLQKLSFTESTIMFVIFVLLFENAVNK
jgi:hypothetical protein